MTVRKKEEELVITSQTVLNMKYQQRPAACEGQRCTRYYKNNVRGYNHCRHQLHEMKGLYRKKKNEMKISIGTKVDTDKRRNSSESAMNKTKIAQSNVGSQTLNNKRNSSRGTDTVTRAAYTSVSNREPASLNKMADYSLILHNSYSKK